MELSGPFSYHITFNAEGIISVEAHDGSTKFYGRVSQSGPKLYIVSSNQQPVYVGATRQGIRTRLRSGFRAKGGSGYYGYRWRYSLSSADLDIWLQASGDTTDQATIETVEAEVVFLIRQISGQWPEFQTEIHFHQSNAMHRAAARKIIDHYGGLYAQPPHQRN